VNHHHIRHARSLAGLAVALALFTGAGSAATPREKVLHSFQGGSDGETPESALVFDVAGNLYGTTIFGGSPADAGTVFELTPTAQGWNEVVIYAFQGGSDGGFANSGLIIDANGNLYGTTLLGGTVNDDCPGGCGVVFELSPPVNGGAWTESVLYAFQGGQADGAGPGSGVILDDSGNLYGTTEVGGVGICSGGCGTAFELSPTSGGWTEKVLHVFQGGVQDGAAPVSGLTMDKSGNLYGATSGGGTTRSIGTVYELSPANAGWTEQILYAFPGDGGRGRNPMSTLVFDSKGDLVGTAEGGEVGGQCCGVVFALVPSRSGKWTQVVAFRFTNDDGGGASSATPVFDAHGDLIGTGGGGLYSHGTVYELTRTEGGITEGYFGSCAQAGCPGGSAPGGGVILDSFGNLYGTTEEGGLGYGVVYEITP
jgi:uncharacterized repeat protein (TIGR03803 family)